MFKALYPRKEWRYYKTFCPSSVVIQHLSIGHLLNSGWLAKVTNNFAPLVFSLHAMNLCRSLLCNTTLSHLRSKAWIVLNTTIPRLAVVHNSSTTAVVRTYVPLLWLAKILATFQQEFFINNNKISYQKPWNVINIPLILSSFCIYKILLDLTWYFYNHFALMKVSCI